MITMLAIGMTGIAGFFCLAALGSILVYYDPDTPFDGQRVTKRDAYMGGFLFGVTALGLGGYALHLWGVVAA